MKSEPLPYVSEIRLKGRAEGLIAGMAKAVLRTLERRGVDVTDEARQRILKCGDLEMLDDWLNRALTVATIDELFI